jgi:nucleoside-diphosphate-sugar epimerase
MSELVLVTGAGGYVGRALCAALRARGYRVREALRRPVSGDGADCVALEMEDAAAGRLESGLLREVRVVFHLAGIAHRSADAAAQGRVNCAGTLALAEAADAAGVGHFVYVSSIYAAAVEDPPRDGVGDGYARSKRQAENGLLAGERRWRMRVTVVRPALVYGGAMKGRLATLQRLAERGLLPELPRTGNTPMIALPDLVCALVLLGSHPTISGNVFTLTDGERYPLERIARTMLRRAGRARGAWRVPAGVFALALRVAAGLQRLPLVGRRVALPRGLRDWRVEPDARLCALGWRPAHTLESLLCAESAVERT